MKARPYYKTTLPYTSKNIISKSMQIEDKPKRKTMGVSLSTPTLDEKIFALVDRIVCGVAFGKSYGGNQFKDQKFQEVIGKTTKMMDSLSAENFFPSVGWIVDVLTGLRGRLEKSFHNLDEYFDRVIDEHLDLKREKLEEDDFVDVLIGLLNDEASDYCLTRDQIKAMHLVKKPCLSFLIFINSLLNLFMMLDLHKH